MKKGCFVSVLSVVALAVSACDARPSLDDAATAAVEPGASPSPALEAEAEAALVAAKETYFGRIRVSDGEARVIALRNAPFEGRIVRAVLEERDSLLVFAYELRAEEDGDTAEIVVDAVTGEVVVGGSATTSVDAASGRAQHHAGEGVEELGAVGADEGGVDDLQR